MTDKDFDIKIRSMLEDAVGEVPEGVWEGISASLDKAAAKKRPAPVFWWRTLGATAAAAAVVALGIILWPAPKGNFKEVDSGVSGPVAVVTPSEGAPDVTPATDPVEGLSTVPSVVPSAVPSASAAHHRRPVAEEASVASESTAPEAVDVLTETAPYEDLSGQVSPVSEQGAPVSDQVPPVSDRTETVETVDAADAAGKSASTSETSGVNFPEFTGIPASPGTRQPARRTDFTVGGNAFAASTRTVAATGIQRSAAASRQRLAPLRSPQATGITPSGETSRYGLPVTFSAGARFYITKRFSLGTGVGYTFLTRTFPGTYNEVGLDEESGNQTLIRSVSSDNIHNDQHYIGVPVNAYYDFVQGGRVRAYVHAGGEIEKNVRSHYRVPAGNETISYNEKVKGVQWSVGGGLGVEVRLGKYVGLYVDPGVRYYFKGNQPASIRTVQPVMFGFDAGLRFNLDRQ